ncbi:hypothetical protein Q5752_000896 [Cryptotrichosporon argae]
MVTTQSPSPPASPEQKPSEGSGFFDLLIKSIFEPGANHAVVLAMNVSFFLLILTLFGLAFLTSWNKHVLILLGVSTLLWATMAWFILELTRVQVRRDNMPVTVLVPDYADSSDSEPKKDR